MFRFSVSSDGLQLPHIWEGWVIIQGLLFERTIWFIVLLLLVEYALVVAWLRRRTPRLRAAMLIGLIVCIAVPLLQSLVTTSRERIALTCEAMVLAVEVGDVESLGSYVSESFATEGLDRDAFMARVRSALERSEVEDASLTIERIEITGSRAVVVFRVKCVISTDEYNGPFPSKWQVEFEQRGEQWLLVSVMPISTPTFPFNSLRQLIP